MTSKQYSGNIDTNQFRMISTSCAINCHTCCKGKMARSKANCQCVCHGKDNLIL